MNLETVIAIGEIEVKTQLVLEKIAEVEYIEITDEEKSKELERLAGIYKTGRRSFKEKFR